MLVGSGSVSVAGEISKIQCNKTEQTLVLHLNVKAKTSYEGY